MKYVLQTKLLYDPVHEPPAQGYFMSKYTNFQKIIDTQTSLIYTIKVIINYFNSISPISSWGIFYGKSSPNTRFRYAGVIAK